MFNGSWIFAPFLVIEYKWRSEAREVAVGWDFGIYYQNNAFLAMF